MGAKGVNPNPLASPEAKARSAKAIEGARAGGASPYDPLPVKRAKAQELRDAGARVMDIAALYGTSKENVCNWLSGRANHQLTELEWGIIQGIRGHDGDTRDGPVTRAILRLLLEAEIKAERGSISIRWTHHRLGS